MWIPESFFAAPVQGGCNAVVQMYSKAHGRLYQILKMQSDYSGLALTGRLVNISHFRSPLCVGLSKR